MPKLHTRVKRKFALTTSRKHRFRNVTGKKGDKTFLTAEKAKKYAEDNGLKKFEIVPAKRNKRFKIIQPVE